jgi:hypothetical protein
MLYLIYRAAFRPGQRSGCLRIAERLFILLKSYHKNGHPEHMFEALWVNRVQLFRRRLVLMEHILYIFLF